MTPNTHKLSVRFFDEKEVRAVWDDAHAKWWFSVLDIVAVLNDESDYAKVRNYWKYLKAKLRKEHNKLVSATTQLKLSAADGKKYNTDMLDSSVLKQLIQKGLTSENHDRELFMKGINFP